MKKKINYRKAKFKDLEVKQFVLNSDENMFGVVIRKGISFLHDHPFVKVRWIGTSIDNPNSTTTTTIWKHEEITLHVLDMDYIDGVGN